MRLTTAHTLLLIVNHIHRRLCKCGDVHERYILAHLYQQRHWCPSRYDEQTPSHISFHIQHQDKDLETIPTYECPCVKILRFPAVVLLAQVGTVTVDEGNAGVKSFLRLSFSLSFFLSFLLSFSPSPPLLFFLARSLLPLLSLSLFLRSSLHHWQNLAIVFTRRPDRGAIMGLCGHG